MGSEMCIRDRVYTVLLNQNSLGRLEHPVDGGRTATIDLQQTTHILGELRTCREVEFASEYILESINAP